MLLPLLYRILRRAARIVVGLAVGVLLVLPAVLSVVLYGSRYWSYVHDRREDALATA